MKPTVLRLILRCSGHNPRAGRAESLAQHQKEATPEAAKAEPHRLTRQHYGNGPPVDAQDVSTDP